MIERIYADFNSLAGRGEECAIILDGLGTLMDLSRKGIKLKEGIELRFWDASDHEEDLEVTATVRFQKERNRWIGEFNRDQIEYLEVKEREASEFLCFHCRHDLTKIFKGMKKPEEMICPSCGGSLLEPIKPPNET